MLDIKFIRENPELVKENFQNRGVVVDIDELLELDQKRRELLQETQGLRHEQKTGGPKLKPAEMSKLKKVKTKLKDQQEKLKQITKKYNDLLCQVPNMLKKQVPVGKDETGNKVLKENGKKPDFNFKVKDHSELGKALNLIDAKRGAKAAGTRFIYLKNEAALLKLALIRLAIKKLTKQGFIPVFPPVMIKAGLAKGMGYLEQADEQEAYYLPKDGLYLIGTSEQSIGVMHANEVFNEKDLPKRYVGFSTCFRREAGSYGKDTQDMIRLHQFDKVEMFSFCKPDQSEKEHQFFLKMQEELMQELKLPYRVMQLCSGDLGRPSAATIDIETWFPSQNKYRETHSTSNCTDFQARRLNIKFKNTKTNKLELVHMINGTAIADRPIAAILENFQQKNGTIKMPKAIVKELGFKTIPKK